LVDVAGTSFLIPHHNHHPVVGFLDQGTPGYLSDSLILHAYVHDDRTKVALYVTNGDQYPHPDTTVF
jgi:hypothetical protein